MDKIKILKLLKTLYITDVFGVQTTLHTICYSKVKNACGELGVDPNNLFEKIGHISLNTNDDTPEWKYISIHMYLLNSLLSLLTKGEMLSIDETKVIKNAFQNVLEVAICKNTPGLRNATIQIESYRRLAGTLKEVMKYVRTEEFGHLLIPEYLKLILQLLYHIVYCPLKESELGESDYIIFTQEKKSFKTDFEYLKTNVFSPIYVKETMMLLESSAPLWIKQALTENLNSIFFSEKGIQHVAAAMLDGTDDTTKTWKSLEVISRLVLSCRVLPSFREKVCKQIIELLHMKTVPKIYERLYVVCTKKLFAVDKSLCDDTLLKHVRGLVLHFADVDNFADGEDVTKPMEQIVRLYHSCFVEGSPELPSLPSYLMESTVLILLRFYTNLNYNKLGTIFQYDLKVILQKYFESCVMSEMVEILDAYFFLMNPNGYPDMNKIEFVCTNKLESIKIKRLDYTLKPQLENCGGDIMEISSSNNKIPNKLLTYLLNCLIENEKYFECDSNTELLHLEGEPRIPESVDRRFMVLKLLTALAEHKQIQRKISDSPEELIKYINSVLTKSIKSQLHKIEEPGSDLSQTIFTVLQILEALVVNSDARFKYAVLKGPLSQIANETSNKELREYVGGILKELDGSVESVVEEEMSEAAAALRDITDPLLPVRGHALITLAKLIERRDKEAMERRQYILNVFQQHLKDDDSYIYLSAIKGLAAMADTFPDTVLSILTEEYSDFQRKGSDCHEIRMKLGEVLVRVTALLGEMAPKYKALLLNTFLVGAKDDDHLVRASSLSNLGEICRVLGYKLGTVVSEVLDCVQGVITFDKAPEPRRAAVTVLRQLFAGLEKETIVFLKDEILPIYRSLKYIHTNDQDEVMKLQAQLALEELNENVKEYLVPKTEIGNKMFVLK